MSFASDKAGVYVLVIEACGEAEVGRLGRQRFDGTYLYVGSALGPGGLKRIERHCAVADGRNRTCHWHIDYLLVLGDLKSTFISGASWPSPRRRGLECALARELAKRAEPAIEGFGASDCRCRTHLFKTESGYDETISEAMRTLGLKLKTLNFCKGESA